MLDTSDDGDEEIYLPEPRINMLMIEILSILGSGDVCYLSWQRDRNRSFERLVPGTSEEKIRQLLEDTPPEQLDHIDIDSATPQNTRNAIPLLADEAVNRFVNEWRKILLKLPVFLTKDQAAKLRQRESDTELEALWPQIREKLEATEAMIDLQRTNDARLQLMQRDHQGRARDWFKNEMGRDPHFIENWTELEQLVSQHSNSIKVYEAFCDSVGANQVHLQEVLMRLLKHPDQDVCNSARDALRRLNVQVGTRNTNAYPPNLTAMWKRRRFSYGLENS